MTEAQMLKRFVQCVSGRRHEHYARTVEVAEQCATFVTGRDMAKMMRQFVRRENDELFKQRCLITIHIIKSTLKNIRDVFKKAPRSNYRREIRYEGENSDNKSKEMEEIAAGFHAKMSVDRWCAVRLQELNDTDPNTWVVLEWGHFDHRKELARPYPFESAAADTLDHEHDERGRLLYLIVRTTYHNEASDKNLERYTLYMPNRSVSLDQVEMSDMSVAPRGVEAIAGRYFVRVEHLPHNLGHVPAMCVGYERDLETKGATFVAPYDAAVPYFMKTIKSNSELDLTVSLHAHPLPIRAGEACDAHGCMGGRVYDHSAKTESACDACGGSGFKRPTSTQEEIVVSMPKSADNMIDLDKLLVFKTPSVEFIKWMDEYVDNLTRKSIRAVFNSDIFTRSEIAETATGKSIDLDNVYDALFPYMQQYAAVWEFLIRGIAAVTDRAEGLYARLVIRRDGKLKTFDNLMADWKSANDTGASAVVRQYLQNDMALAMFADEPEKYNQWLTRERFNPFSGQSETNTMLLLTSDLVPRRQKVLYANIGYVFDVVDREHPEFYRYDAAKQDAVVDEMVDSLLAILDGGPSALLDGTREESGDVDRLGNIPLALQQLSLSQFRLQQGGNKRLAGKIERKIDELLAEI